MISIRHIRHSTLLVLLFSTSIVVLGQEKAPASLTPANAVIISAGETMGDIIRKAANVIPSQRQYEWQKLEFVAFIHFGINTFMDREWGEGDEDISQFNPTALDAKQWASVCKEAGMKLIVLTAKHHDGFCLWPSQYTEHSVKNAPWRNGNGDLVRELSEACREAGMKFGVYLSPWDRREPTFGTPAYNEFFRNQLTELLTSYGGVSEVWFDGANGEGPNGKKQEYNWQSYYQLIRRLQPDAVIAVMGPDVRWVGTESGYGRQTEWSVLPGNRMDADQIAARSQQAQVDGAFIPRNLMDEDLGSRDKIKSASSLIWYPSETDVSIRPGWFYHRREDDQVKTPEKLVDIYYNSVGLNSVLLLNLPPDRRGLIHENDVKSLNGMRRILDETFKKNLVDGAAATASHEKKGNEAKFIIDGIEQTYWTTDASVDAASIAFRLAKKQTFDRALLQENILVGQRIEKFHLAWWNGKQWHRLAEGTTVGYKRLLRFPAVTASRVKLVIEQSRTSPTLSAFGLFKAPYEKTPE
jgi:alpha-L-fucosidase